MATSGRGSGVVGYNVQVAVDTARHLIITHEVTNVGTDRSQLSPMAKRAKATLEVEHLEAVADRGYFNGEEILACENAGVSAATLPKPMTSNSKAEGRFGKQDFRYLAEEDVYVCPAGERLTYHFYERGKRIGSTARYWTNVCRTCAIKQQVHDRRAASHHPLGARACSPRRCSAGSTNIRRRCASGARRSSIPSAPSRLGWAQPHFLMKTLPKVATEMALRRAGLQYDAGHEHLGASNR